MQETAELARGHRGPEAADLLYAVGSSARQSALQDASLTPERRAEVIEVGLLSLSMAIVARRDLAEAYTDRSLLLQESAKLTPDPEARQGLLNEAERLRQQAAGIQASAREAKRLEADIAAGRTLRPGGEVTRPEKLSGDLPVYTERAREERLSGVVLVELVVDEQGAVAEARVLKGMPEGLDRSCLKALREWKFEPATRKGKPVRVLLNAKVKFTPPDQVEVELE
jgi:TonB family protein